jgi:hypothetical protein
MLGIAQEDLRGPLKLKFGESAPKFKESRERDDLNIKILYRREIRSEWTC